MNRQQHPSVRERATFGTTSGPVPADFLMEMECIGLARNYTTYHLGTALEADDIGGIIWNYDNICTPPVQRKQMGCNTYVVNGVT